MTLYTAAYHSPVGPIVIPCHRVITAHGKLGGYAYGIELKRHLLEWEKSPTETFAMRTNRALQG